MDAAKITNEAENILAPNIGKDFATEVKRLLKTGACPFPNIDPQPLYAAALVQIAANMVQQLRSKKQVDDFNNYRKF